MNLLNEIEVVLRSGVCIGCGVCSSVAPAAISMNKNANGAWEAVVTNPTLAAQTTGELCPFSSDAPNEDAHAQVLFGHCSQEDSYIGRFRGIWAAHAAIGDYRQEGSSGGIGSLLLVQALREGLVDIVVHVGQCQSAGDLFEYSISRNEEEVMRAAKTRYYSVNMALALREAMASGQRIALVGVPCFVKAARNLARREEKFFDQLVLTVSLFCGHMKSSFFAESLAWQAGVFPDEIKTVDFRTKLVHQDASKYGFTVASKRGEKIVRPMRKLLGRRWDCGFFRLKGCDYCDDVVGETADISLGDAWLPGIVSDWRGHNIVVTRSTVADRLFRSLIEEKYVAAQPIGREELIQSQGGGFRDRREGLAYRLYQEDQKGHWRPKKRVNADNTHISIYRKIIYRLRRTSRARSFSSFRLSKSWKTIYPFVFEMSVWNFMLVVLTQFPSLLGRTLSRTSVRRR